MTAYLTSAVLVTTGTVKTITASLSAPIGATANDNCKSLLRLNGATTAHSLTNIASSCSIAANSSTMFVNIAKEDTDAFEAALVGELTSACVTCMKMVIELVGNDPDMSMPESMLATTAR